MTLWNANEVRAFRPSSWVHAGGFGRAGLVLELEDQGDVWAGLLGWGWVGWAGKACCGENGVGFAGTVLWRARSISISLAMLTRKDEAVPQAYVVSV